MTTRILPRALAALAASLVLPALVVIVTLAAAAHRPAPAFTPTSEYLVKSMRGWTVRLNPALASDAALCEATLGELDHQLYAIVRVVPPAALERLRAIPIWAEVEMPKTQCMCYHVSKEWLVPNAYNPDKEGAVEIGNAAAFLDWTHGQPWMVLHELAHGFHDQVYGYGNEEIIAAWKRIAATGVYDRVAHISGKPRRHYALTNQMEWFAECSEALFGTNDFHPFVRSELREIDPDGAALLERLWREPPPITRVDAPAEPPLRPGAR